MMGAGIVEGAGAVLPICLMFKDLGCDCVGCAVCSDGALCSGSAVCSPPGA
jgi:hypothetical protein